MFRLFMAALAITALLAIPPVLAANHSDPQVAQRLDEARARLELSDDQLERLTPVVEASMRAQRSILSKYGIDLDSADRPQRQLGLRQLRSMSQELETARTDTLGQLQVILNADQLLEFKRMQQEQQAKMRERIRGRQ